jgi:hypothetical protein
MRKKGGNGWKIVVRRRRKMGRERMKARRTLERQGRTLGKKLLKKEEEEEGEEIKKLFRFSHFLLNKYFLLFF